MNDWLAHLVMRITELPETRIQRALRQPLTHQSNRLYDMWVEKRHWIAKEFLKPDEYAESPRREFEALKRLSHLDIAPQPIHFEPHSATNAPVVFYEYVEGEMWDRRTPTANELIHLADVWLKMHTVNCDDLWQSRSIQTPLVEVAARIQQHFRNYAVWAEAHFPEGRSIAALCLDLLRKRQDVIAELEASQPVSCFCRADPRFANVIQRPDGRLALVDWEDSGLSDPALDLADLITHPNQEDLVSDAQWQPFLDRYIAERSEVDALLAHRMQLYMGLFPIFWVATLMNWGLRLAQSNQLAGWQVNGLPANERLRRYLARSLVWPHADMSPSLDEVERLNFFPMRLGHQ